MSQDLPASRILIVDDDPVMRFTASALLTRAGLEADTAQDGESALRALADRHYDLVLMDVMMPGMDGLETTRRIRLLPEPWGRAPILAWTAAEAFLDKDHCLAAGMDGFVAKRTDHSLLEAVTHWLEAGSDPEWAPRLAQSSAPQLLEPGILDQLRDDVGSDLLPEILETFVVETRRRVARVVAAATAGDAAQAGREAHALKGSAATFGATLLRDTALAAEQAGQAGDLERVRGLAQQLTTLVEETLAELDARLAGDR